MLVMGSAPSDEGGTVAKKKTSQRTSSAPRRGAGSRAKSSSRQKTTKKPGTSKKSGVKTAKQTGTERSRERTSVKKSRDTEKTSQPKIDAAPVKPAGEKKDSVPKPADAKKSGRKGITIVDKSASKPVKPKPMPAAWPTGGGILSSGAKRKPLIPSGPKNVVDTGEVGDDRPILKKTPFTKRELARFKEILLQKRAELVGDISNIESEALTASSGGLSHTPQHMAEQGSEAYDQSLSLGLAAADRHILKEIDAALQRIEDGTYGVCEVTGKPIRPERLEEVPWARYSIEAARALERGRR